MYIPWWSIPALFALAAAFFYIRAEIKRRKEPAWTGTHFPLPTFAGLGNWIVAMLLVAAALIFLAGHYMV